MKNDKNQAVTLNVRCTFERSSGEKPDSRYHIGQKLVLSAGGNVLKLSRVIVDTRQQFADTYLIRGPQKS